MRLYVPAPLPCQCFLRKIFSKKISNARTGTNKQKTEPLKNADKKTFGLLPEGFL